MNVSRKNEDMGPKQKQNKQKKHTQLWMWLVMEVKYDTVKSNIA